MTRSLHDEIEQLDVMFLPPWQRRRSSATRFGPHVLPTLEREYGVGVLHQRVLPQFPLYFATDEAPVVSGYVDYVAFTSDRERAILVHCVGQNVAHHLRQLGLYEHALHFGFHDLLGRVARLFCNSRNKRGHFVLLYLLQAMNLLRLPFDLMTEMAKPAPRGVAEFARGIEVVASVGIEVARFEIHEGDLVPDAAG